MNTNTKRILFSLGLLIIWFGFISTGPSVVINFVISALAGWFVGGLIYSISKKVFPYE